MLYPQQYNHNSNIHTYLFICSSSHTHSHTFTGPPTHTHTPLPCCEVVKTVPADPLHWLEGWFVLAHPQQTVAMTSAGLARSVSARKAEWTTASLPADSSACRSVKITEREKQFYISEKMPMGLLSCSEWLLGNSFLAQIKITEPQVSMIVLCWNTVKFSPINWK